MQIPLKVLGMCVHKVDNRMGDHYINGYISASRDASDLVLVVDEEKFADIMWQFDKEMKGCYGFHELVNVLTKQLPNFCKIAKQQERNI